MSKGTFASIVEEIMDYGTPVRFIGWGEPLLHPNLLEFLTICKKNGIRTHLNTNGRLLSEEMMQKFVEIPLDSLKFSFQGVDQKSYSEMRNIDFFRQLLDKIRTFYQIRGSSPYPYIHISSTITYESPEQVRVFREEIQKYVDLVTVGRTRLDHIDLNKVNLKPEEKSRFESLIKCESVSKIHTPCSEVFNVLSINWDGSVSACCADYDKKMVVGDLKKTSLIEIWKSRKMQNYRKILGEMKHDTFEICRTCYDYMDLKVQENVQ
jgi:radical SAM protein with 4Fe4S-binding SPASM domain